MDERAKKAAFRMISYGLYVLTAADDDRIAAGTVTWLSQASFVPPLVMVGIKVGSSLHTAIEASQKFAVNILGAEQKEVAQAFFRPSQVSGSTINGYPFEMGKTGAPLLTNVPARLEARVVNAVKRGDHTVFIGEILDATVRDATQEPLVLRDTGWSYGG